MVDSRTVFSVKRKDHVQIVCDKRSTASPVLDLDRHHTLGKAAQDVQDSTGLYTVRMSFRALQTAGVDLPPIQPPFVAVYAPGGILLKYTANAQKVAGLVAGLNTSSKKTTGSKKTTLHTINTSSKKTNGSKKTWKNRLSLMPMVKRITMLREMTQSLAWFLSYFDNPVARSIVMVMIARTLPESVQKKVLAGMALYESPKTEFSKRSWANIVAGQLRLQLSMDPRIHALRKEANAASNAVVETIMKTVRRNNTVFTPEAREKRLEQINTRAEGNTFDRVTDVGVSGIKYVKNLFSYLLKSVKISKEDRKVLTDAMQVVYIQQEINKESNSTKKSKLEKQKQDLQMKMALMGRGFSHLANSSSKP